MAWCWSLLCIDARALSPIVQADQFSPAGQVGAAAVWQRLYARPEWLLLGLAAWHLLFWVLVPASTYRMLPLDTLELLGWGQEWQWGYYKHPPLGAWLGEITRLLGGGSLDGLYVLAQLCVLLTFFYVWRTARLFLDARAAVLATVILEGAYWYTFLTPNFNMNTLQLPVWAGLSFHFLSALRGNQRHWIAWGVFVCLCVLTKYSGLLIIVSCGAVLVFSPLGRASLRRPGPYLGLLVACLLLIPHLLWLHEHWRLPWSYLRGFDRPAVSVWYRHFLEPLRFAAGALLGLLFSALLFLLVRRRGRMRPLDQHSWILLQLCFWPLLLAVGYGAVSGSHLKSTWAFGFFNLAGVIAFCILPTRDDLPAFRRFVVGLISVALLFAAGHWIYKTQSDRSKTAFDGPALALAVAAHWDARTEAPLRIVIGDHMLTAIVSGYAPSRPSMLVNGDYAISPWLSPAGLDRWGGVLVCAVERACLPGFAARAAGHRRIQIDAQDFDVFVLPPSAAVH